MPAKRRVIKKRRVAHTGIRVMGGSGFFSKLGRAIRKIGRFAKKHKIVSKGANLWSELNLPGAERAKILGVAAGAAGYGLRRAGGGLKRAGGGRYVRKTCGRGLTRGGRIKRKPGPKPKRKTKAKPKRRVGRPRKRR